MRNFLRLPTTSIVTENRNALVFSKDIDHMKSRIFIYVYVNTSIDYFVTYKPF